MEPGYELIRRIAGGGMGEVFVARRTGAGNFEKHVALKLLLPHLAGSPDLVRRFHDEARLAARMHHPNIVEIFDVGETDGRPFIAMQWVEGVTLGRLLRETTARGERMPLPVVRLLATSLCEALSYAHGLVDGQGRALRVVHRDVTPGNVLVSGMGAVLLTDFGIARVRDGSMTEPGVLRGKAAYLAPEQILLDAPVDARADIYAAALTLYEALTGVQPYRRETMKDAIDAVMRGVVEDVRALRDDVSERMAAALNKAMARKPVDRFETARQLREAFVDGPVATSPELADYVRRVCGDVSKPLLQPVDTSGPGATRSVITVTPTHLVLPEQRPLAKPRRVWPLALVSSVAVVLLGVGAWWVPGLLSNSAAGRGVATDVRPSRTDIPPTGTDMVRKGTDVLPTGTDMVRNGTDVLPTGTDMLQKGTDVSPTGTDIVSGGTDILPVDTDSPQPTPDAQKRRPTTRVVRRVKATPVVTPAAVRVGYVTADAAPWAEVLLDGKVLDRTPFVRYPLPVGRYTLLFRGPSGATQKKAVTVTEGAVTAVKVEFK